MRRRLVQGPISRLCKYRTLHRVLSILRACWMPIVCGCLIAGAMRIDLLANLFLSCPFRYLAAMPTQPPPTHLPTYLPPPFISSHIHVPRHLALVHIVATQTLNFTLFFLLVFLYIKKNHGWHLGGERAANALFCFDIMHTQNSWRAGGSANLITGTEAWVRAHSHSHL
jgi:hypothetical protein